MQVILVQIPRYKSGRFKYPTRLKNLGFLMTCMTHVLIT
uniref:Uncharacterized protein n=1 Tax=Arundo donax TaxID=35708 RepID=A0A0A8YSN2_ARUDO